MSDAPAGEPSGDGPSDGGPEDLYYRGVITRVYYGSASGTLRSEASGREYRFRAPLVDIRGPIPRFDGLREGMQVGFDLSRSARGVFVSLIRVLD